MTVAVLSKQADGRWAARFPYHDGARLALKALGCRWAPEAKAWTFDAYLVGNVIATLELFGLDVMREIPPPYVPPVIAAPESAAEAFLASLPARLREPAFRALSRVLHPDVQGDTAAMQALNAARERVGCERRSA